MVRRQHKFVNFISFRLLWTFPNIPTTFCFRSVKAICIAPSRELARQIMQVINTMAAFTKATTGYAIQGSIPRGTILTQHIIVATPGALLNAIQKKQIDTSQVKIFVADEADNMLDQQGLGDQTLRVKK